MIFSTNTFVPQQKFGAIDGVKKIIEAGFPAIDMSFFRGSWIFTHDGDKIALAKEMRKIADDSGVIFNQAHAPFGKPDIFYEDCLPRFPEIFECCAILGIKNIIVHPIINLRHYGNEEALFNTNMEFYNSIKPLSRDNGVKIALENMYEAHPQKKQYVDSVCADPKELCRYYDSLGDSENFTVCLDLGHVALCNREPEDAIRAIGHDRLGALHVHDVDYVSDLHTAPYVSKLNWDNICRALGEIDYKGEFTLETDHFFRKADNDFYPVALKFLADTARYLAEKVDGYRNNK